MGKKKEIINYYNFLRYSNIIGYVNYYKGY